MLKSPTLKLLTSQNKKENINNKNYLGYLVSLPELQNNWKNYVEYKI